MLFSRLCSKTLIALSLCVFILACSSTLYQPTSENVSDPERLVELQEGRKLYVANCSSCHNLYKPQKFTLEKWAHEMDEMKMEAKITDQQASSILQYLAAAPAKE